MLQLETLKFNLPKAIEYPLVRQFLASKSKKSWRTARTYRNQLLRLHKFLVVQYPSYSVESILAELQTKKVDVYRLLDQLSSFWTETITPASVQLTINAVKSYFQYYDVEINSHKFKIKVTLPSNRKEDERPLDKADVRRIILASTGLRLRTYCLLLANTGCRAVEGLAVRLKDIDFTVRPTKLYLRAEYSKNKLPREVYLSDEASDYLKRLISQLQISEPNQLVFGLKSQNPDSLYFDMRADFVRALDSIDMAQWKEGNKRHEITLHSFRRFVKTVVEDATSHSFSEYILGHKKSVYYTKKEPERRALWYEKCAKILTFLDYETLDRREKGIEAQIQQKDKQMDIMSKDIDSLRELVKLQQKQIEQLMHSMKA